jgi:D-3-phosphoglycerate dehydrogenase
MTKYNILTLNQISSQGLHRFPGARYAVGKAIAQPDAILVRSHNMFEMAIPASVKAIGRAGAGTNNIPVAEMSRRGVPVFNAPGANANAVKELVLAALLMAARNIVPAIRYVNGLEPAAPDLERQVEDGKKQFAGTELPGRTLGIVGLGAIGGLVADTAIKLGMKVTGFDPKSLSRVRAAAVERAQSQLCRGVAQACRFRDAAPAADRGHAASHRRQAPRAGEAGRGTAQFCARCDRR